jgi:quercetin dioxygenase-like cupin family protein
MDQDEGHQEVAHVSDVHAEQAEAGLGIGITRRSLMEAAGALLCLAGVTDVAGAAGVAHAQTKPAGGPSRAPLFQSDLPDLAIKGWAVTAVEVKYAPGQASGPHRHPGITIAHVLEGEVVSKVGDGPEKTYKAGEMWMETPNQLHAVSRNASDSNPARLLAILLAEKGAQLTTPAD